MSSRTSTYDLTPAVPAPAAYADACWRGWPGIGRCLRDASRAAGARSVVAIECYPGVFEAELRAGIGAAFADVVVWDTNAALLRPDQIDALVEPWLGDDPVFGRMCPLDIEAFFAAEQVAALRRSLAERAGPVVLVGPGAAAIAADPDLLVFADMPRWEGQLRQRRREVANLGARNHELTPSLKYKRSFFVDWRVCDRLKRRTMHRWDFVLDTTIPGDPKMISGAAHRAVLAAAAARPFRVVPFFDPGPWGGQWMKARFGLDPAAANFAWGFDCVPEENSLLLEFADGRRVEIPAVNLVFAEPERLLGEAVYGRFGAEFPIRFDFLDTMGGGNLSFQVHPPTGYAWEQFGLQYTQDESYYLLDAGPGAHVFLGCKRGTNPDEMFAALTAAQRGDAVFPDERFAARFPAKKHDHFLIPAGTLHCSGADAMVLEISATPYIFTFKLWDWGRLGLDGKPRPISLRHGRNVVRWDRDEAYARRRLINQVRQVGSGAGWREERTGLHDAEFIETRRHWFTGSVPHDTCGGVNVLNLVEGEEAIVESPTGAFAPFVVHYAETFIVPAAVGPYVIRPHGPGAHAAAAGRELATIKAFVRTHP